MRPFEPWFASHYAAIAAYARRRCANPQDAEDVTAEAFAVAWRRFDATVLRLPAPVVSARLSRARKRLAAALDPATEEPGGEQPGVRPQIRTMIDSARLAGLLQTEPDLRRTELEATTTTAKLFVAGVPVAGLNDATPDGRRQGPPVLVRCALISRSAAAPASARRRS